MVTGHIPGTYTVQASDNQDSGIEATNVTLTDAAGNVSNSATSTGSTLKVDTIAPTVLSVTINPNSGTLNSGDDIVITVIAGSHERGLIASNAQINGKSVPLVELKNGKYTGVYTIEDTDNQGNDVEATGITLTDAAGNVSAAGSSSGSSLSIDTSSDLVTGDTQAPTITSVTISPNSGTLTTGSGIVITVLAGNRETGLTPSNADINGKSIPISELADGLYRGIYTIQAGDNQGTNVEAENITLTDAAGNTSTPVSTTGSNLSIVTQTAATSGQVPVVESVTVNPNHGWITVGDSVYIEVKAANQQDGLTPSKASFNGKLITLQQKVIRLDAYNFQVVTGTFTGVYVVQVGDNQGKKVEATNITLTDTSGNVSAPASSSGSSLMIDTEAPTIKNVKLEPVAEKTVGVGESINIIVTAEGNETGLIPSDATVNGKLIALYDMGDGTYRGVYTVGSGDTKVSAIEATNITLADAAGNVSAPASSSNSGVTVKSTEEDAERADFNSDGTVNLGDLVLFGSSWGAESSKSGWNDSFDLNKDGSINLGDLVILGNLWAVSTTSKVVAKTVGGTSQVESESDVVIEMNAELDKETSAYYVKISLSNTENINGFGLTLSYNDEALEFIDDSVNGLVGLSIAREENGVIALSSFFNNEEFGGSVTIGFKPKESNQSMDVELIDALVSSADGISKITELAGITLNSLQSTGVISDITVEKASERSITLNFTAPSSSVSQSSVLSYIVELMQQNSTDNDWDNADKISLSVTPKEPGQKEEILIDGLKAGFPYNIAVKYTYGDSLESARSNIASAQTLIEFIDDDLDYDDPFIIRDEDSLFVADNDNEISFEWNSWEASGAVSYRVNVADGDFDQIIDIYTIQDTTFVVEGEPGKSYALKVIPLDAAGQELGEMYSRFILCSPAVVGKPGKPEMVTSE